MNTVFIFIEKKTVNNSFKLVNLQKQLKVIGAYQPMDSDRLLS